MGLLPETVTNLLVGKIGMNPFILSNPKPDIGNQFLITVNGIPFPLDLGFRPSCSKPHVCSHLIAVDNFNLHIVYIMHQNDLKVKSKNIVLISTYYNSARLEECP